MGTRTVGTTSRKTGGIFVPIFKEVRNIKSKTYEEFVEKFKPKKTTDDCYTPVTPPIDLSNVFVVWGCKTLQNYKCLVSTTVSGDGIYAEYTYNGDKQELYEDVYKKVHNKCHEEE